MRGDAANPPGRFADGYTKILESLCGVEDLTEAATDLVELISDLTCCEAVALRVHDRKDDYPYLVQKGFEEGFLEKENLLCRVDDRGRAVRDENGRAELECMCGLVLGGRTDPGRPFFTEAGSFWTNSTTELLASTSNETRGTVTRNTCNIWGYESVALVPVPGGGEIVGLLQANSRERGRFDRSMIDFLEKVCRRVGPAIERCWCSEELRRLEKEFEESRRGSETMVALGEMAATLAHEVKNPLAGMMLSATRLRKALRGDEKLEPLVEHLCSSINTLSETVVRATDSVRGPKIERSEIGLNELLESAVSLVAPAASAKGVRIIREFDPDLPRLLGDASFLRRAFLNLLLNGLEAMPLSGSLRAETRKAEDREVEVIIADTGPGIDPVDADKVFDPFFSKKPGGTGLGLGIVRRIVELHSGTVSLRPGAAGGTEAVVRLPAGGAEAGAR